MSRVVYVDADMLQFDDGSKLYSEHAQDCCETHCLDFSNYSVVDFEGLDFDLSSSFFERVDDYGIRLLPINGHTVSVPGYGYNNGYYSANLRLVLERPDSFVTFDISDCQTIYD
jgi:hypothetical protein